MLYNIVYASSARFLYSEEILQEILSASHFHNTKLGITGMLLYVEGNIMQVLEGEKDKVEALYQKIQRDTRHNNVFILTQGYIEQRSFGKWSMGLHQMSQDKLNECVAVELFESERRSISVKGGSRKYTSPALILMKSFYESMVKRGISTI